MSLPFKYLASLNLSRALVYESFADGLLLAEIVHRIAPILVSKMDLQRLEKELDEDPSGKQCWCFLGLGAFIQLRISVTDKVSQDFRLCKPRITEFLEVMLKHLFQYRANGCVVCVPIPFRGVPLRFRQTRAWELGKTVIEMQTRFMLTTRDIIGFFDPIVVLESQIFRFHSTTEQRTVYILIDDPNVPSRILTLNKRVVLKIQKIDKLLMQVFQRGLIGTGSWIGTQKRLHICNSLKKSYIQPEEMFLKLIRFVVSMFQLFPWDQKCGVTDEDICNMAHIASCCFEAIRKAKCIDLMKMERLHSRLQDEVKEIKIFSRLIHLK